jgi:hypothetical protein
MHAAVAGVLAAYFLMVALGILLARRQGWRKCCVVHGALGGMVALPVLLNLVGASVGWAWMALILLAVPTEVLLLAGQCLALGLDRPA